MDRTAYRRQFEQLEADIQAAEANLSPSAASIMSNLTHSQALFHRYSVISGMLARDTGLSSNIQLQVLDARVLAAITRLNAAVFRKAAGES